MSATQQTRLATSRKTIVPRSHLESVLYCKGGRVRTEERSLQELPAYEEKVVVPGEIQLASALRSFVLPSQ